MKSEIKNMELTNKTATKIQNGINCFFNTNAGKIVKIKNTVCSNTNRYTDYDPPGPVHMPQCRIVPKKQRSTEVVSDILEIYSPISVSVVKVYKGSFITITENELNITCSGIAYSDYGNDIHYSIDTQYICSEYSDKEKYQLFAQHIANLSNINVSDSIHFIHLMATSCRHNPKKLEILLNNVGNELIEQINAHIMSFFDMSGVEKFSKYTFRINLKKIFKRPKNIEQFCMSTIWPFYDLPSVLTIQINLETIFNAVSQITDMNKTCRNWFSYTFNGKNVRLTDVIYTYINVVHEDAFDKKH